MSRWSVTLEVDEAYWHGDASDALDAAEQAVEHFWDHGAWAGEATPDEVHVTCRNAADPGCAFKVTVSADWAPTWHAHPLGSP